MKPNLLLIPILSLLACTEKELPYSTVETWDEMVAGNDYKYVTPVRISDPGTANNPAYTGFWFYDEEQFDPTGRYSIAMKVYFKEREVTASDVGEIGYIDLQDNNKWTKIGETTAWNWQQGCRLQWRPGTEEILWNDHNDDKSGFISRSYNFKTGKTKTFPRAIYDITDDGRYALTHNFARMRHAGTSYDGVPDPFVDIKAPAETGIVKMDMETGETEFLAGLDRMSEIAFPNGYDGETNLYIFREGWNPSGTRFIAFLRNMDSPNRHVSGWSISADGTDIRYFYNDPSHHMWLGDETIFEGRYFSTIKDDGSGEIVDQYAEVKANIDPSLLPEPYSDWILGDTYVLEGVQHLFLFHIPTKVFVPLAKLDAQGPEGGIFRIDLHARTSRNGRVVSIDSSHEGLGRQLYVLDIGHILDNPPVRAN